MNKLTPSFSVFAPLLALSFAIQASFTGFDAFLADRKAVLDPALHESERAEILGKH